MILLAQMRAPDGRVLDIVPAGVAALEALGWEQVYSEDAADEPETAQEADQAPEGTEDDSDAAEDASEADEDKPAPKKRTATRKRS